MNSRIKFGPLAVFLVIITLVLSTLAVLTLVTSNADRVLAERYAEVTRIKYSLEEKGNRYLEKLDELRKRYDNRLEWDNKDWINYKTARKHLKILLEDEDNSSSSEEKKANEKDYSLLTFNLFKDERCV